MRPERLLAIAAVILAGRWAGAAIVADPAAPRPFGYTIGDVVHQTLHLQLAPQEELVESSLPKAGRAGVWFTRRQVEAAREAGGWRIDITYQAINAPTDVRTVALPAVRLQVRDRGRTVEETMRELPLTLGPITPATVVARAGHDDLRPDAPPPRIDVAPMRHRLALYALLAGLIGVTWTTWYLGFGLRGRRTRPFARAERELRRLLAREPSPQAMRGAMRALHRAFNTTAGEIVFSESLDRFFSGHPAFEPVHDAAAQFFAASRSEFFGHGTAAGDLAGDVDATWLIDVARRLKVLERDAS